MNTCVEHAFLDGEIIAVQLQAANGLYFFSPMICELLQAKKLKKYAKPKSNVYYLHTSTSGYQDHK